MKQLLGISIGPVQDFIAAARRCRDLWYGSRLLSEVSKAAALSLLDDGARLIFPAPDGRTDLTRREFTCANKIVAIVDREDIADVAGRAKQAAADRLLEAGRFERWKLHGTEIDWKRFQRQLHTILEFHAVWTPCEDYAAARERMEHLAAGRKTLRAFADYRGQEGEPKSSLDGARENVIVTRSESLYQSNLKDKEWLDAIGVVKRFAEAAPFESTIDIAAIPYVRGRRNHRPEAMADYDAFLKRNRIPDETYSLLYAHESRQVFDDREVDLEDIQKIRKRLGEPNPPYYAFLLGDGDRMGAAIRQIESPEGHQEFSGALSQFAEDAASLIAEEQHRGCPVYCGGDDVMALLPLDRALECARTVNRLFESSMAKYGLTFSAGLVIAHALEPLTQVREWAKEAEGAAKDKKKGDRSALCISVYPRSGSPVSVWGKWEVLGPLMEEVIRLYQSKEISAGLPHEFSSLLGRTKTWRELDDTIRPLAAAIARHKEQKEAAARLVEEHAKNRAELQHLCNAMLAARPFARAKREAAWDGGAE